MTRGIFPGSFREVLTTYDDYYNIKSVKILGFDLEGNPLSRSTNFYYDIRGRLFKIDGPRTDVADIATMTYHECASGAGCGQPASSTNALGHTTTFDAYDAHGRLLQSTDPNGVVTYRTYDFRNRLTTLAQSPPVGAERITTFDYDGVGQIAVGNFGGMALCAELHLRCSS